MHPRFAALVASFSFALASSLACEINPWVTSLSALPAGERCPAGGLSTVSGIDIDGDGKPDEDVREDVVCFPAPALDAGMPGGDGGVDAGPPEDAGDSHDAGVPVDAGEGGDAGTEPVWTCDPAWFGAEDGCDCGCGIVDIDCETPSVSSCQYVMCPAGTVANPDNNAQCVPDAAVSGFGFDPNGLARALRPVTRAFDAEDCEVTSGLLSAGAHAGIDLGDVVLVNNTDESIAFVMDGTTCDGRPKMDRFAAWMLRGMDGSNVASGDINLVCAIDGAGFTACESSGVGARASTTFVPGLQVPVLYELPLLRTGDVPPGTYELFITIDPDARLPAAARTSGPVVRTIVFDDEGQSVYWPDLVIDETLLASSLSIHSLDSAVDTCLMEEGCFSGTGVRRVLGFSTSTVNIGTADFVIGDPQLVDDVEFSECHGHFHYHDYAIYRLYDAEGQLVVVGAKQSFAVIDVDRGASVLDSRYTQSFQGITRDFADIYSAGLPCQWLDITGVPAGDYELEVEVNPERHIPELSFDNNAVRVPVVVPDDPSFCSPQDEVCGDGIDQDCDGEADDGCPPVDGAVDCASAAPLPIDGSLRAELEPTTASWSSSCGTPGGGVAVFRFITPHPRIATFSTFGTPFDTVIDVLRTDGCKDPEPVNVACSDDACGGTTSQVFVSLEAGTYLVVVRARDAAASGTVTLSVDSGACADATLLDAAEGLDTVATAPFGPDVGATTCAGVGGDVRWAFALCPGYTDVEFGCVGDRRQGMALWSGDCFGTMGQCRVCPVAGLDFATMEGPGLVYVAAEDSSASDGGAGSAAVRLRVTPLP